MEENERPSKIRKLSHGKDHADEPNGLETFVRDGAPDAESGTNSILAQDLPNNESFDQEQLDTNSASVEGPQVPISKNQLKKLRKKEAWEAGRDDRKLKRKEKDRERKARKKAAIKDAIANGREHEVSNIQHPDRRPRPIRRITLPVTFMLDCGFDEFMLERESISLGTQITRSYSEYMKSPYQPHLVVSGWTKENVNRKRFEGLLKGMYKNWTGIMFTEEDFIGASLIAESNMQGPKGGRMIAAFEKYAPLKPDQQQSKPENGDVEPAQESPAAQPTENILETRDAVTAQANGTTHRTQKAGLSSIVSKHFEALQQQGEIIYLTSDSPDTLTELKPYHTYIIGGIVDKNRHKGLCYKRALNANSDPATVEKLHCRSVKTAKLPIGEYMQMASRQVLATNHVVEIMLRWLECRDWGQAFLEVMPKRKGAQLREVSNDAADTPEKSEHGDVEALQVDGNAELAAHTSLNDENGITTAAEVGDSEDSPVTAELLRHE